MLFLAWFIGESLAAHMIVEFIMNVPGQLVIGFIMNAAVCRGFNSQRCALVLTVAVLHVHSFLLLL